MANGIGMRFQPGVDASRDGGGAAGGGVTATTPSRVTPQQAVKVLSLRVPERPSPTALAPQVLLQSKGSAAPGAGGLDSMIAALMQAFRPDAAGPSVPEPRRPMIVPDFFGNSGGPQMPGPRPQGGGAPSTQEPPPAPPRRNPPPPVITPGGGPPVEGDLLAPPAPLPRVDNPWTLPGRNPRLAEKYLGDSFDGFGDDISPLF